MSRAEGFEEMPAGKAENAVYFQSFSAAIEEHRGCFGIILRKTAQAPEHFPVPRGPKRKKPWSGGWKKRLFIAIFASLNTDLTGLDNLYGGGNGVIDGHATADFSVTAAPVPEPSTIMLSVLGLIGMAGYCRKRYSKKG